MINITPTQKSARYTYLTDKGRLFVVVSTDNFIKLTHSLPGNNNSMEILDVNEGFETEDLVLVLAKLDIEISYHDADTLKSEFKFFLEL